MAVLVRTVIERAAKTLIDDAMVGWTEAELYDYYNAAAQAVVTAVPTAHTTRDFIPLVAGVLQALPDDGISLMAIYYNEVSGMICNQVGIELQNQSDPRWPVSTPEVDAFEYMTDERSTRRFFVNPPNNGEGSVLALYAASPPAIDSSDMTSPIPFADLYQNPLWAYILGMAYAKNSKRQDLTKANNYFQMCNQLLGLRATTKIAVAPKLDNQEPQ